MTQFERKCSCVSGIVLVSFQAVQYGRTVVPSACLSPRLYRSERVGSLIVMSFKQNRRIYWGHVDVLMGRNVPTNECVSAVAFRKVEAWMVFQMAVEIGVSTSHPVV